MREPIWLFYNNLVVMIRLFFVLRCEWNGHKNVFYFVFMRNISVARTNTAACRRVDEGCNGLLATCFAAMGAHFRWVANYRKVKQKPGVAGLQYGTCYLRGGDMDMSPHFFWLLATVYPFP
ncbi:hypothetical protein [Aeromonas allosaccharophila]|uniref:hypothetical protein n=1 Tax=Aeromonas allosaccharophila TaxID=656 RepID=UPI001116F7BD|nr:hypothetical protein [Aeromonas allosaccharophila]